ncbi:MAG: 4'-phosphopantetheinyl transferase superfamily protein [Gammaproteobacteria bacterium]|nr:4'-phosphopantetheinyl transferase superfamily protein [Gammaproteobacteria bacterium]
MSSDYIEKNLLSSLQSEFHVWYCCPDEVTDKNILDEYHSILSTEECDKFKRFHFDKDRHSYLISHALVRKVLSSYCNVKPDAWSFTGNQHGKPNISPEIKCPALKFNLSHADGMSVVVVSLDNDCGIDVENTQRKSRASAVAERMFAPAEVAAMQSGNDSEVQRKFFEFWTLREAYVKAIGTGLGGSSKEFYFTVGGQERGEQRMSKIHFVPDDSERSSAWQFILLNLSSEHISAVALKVESIREKMLVSYKFTP